MFFFSIKLYCRSGNEIKKIKYQNFSEIFKIFISYQSSNEIDILIYILILYLLFIYKFFIPLTTFALYTGIQSGNYVFQSHFNVNPTF